MSKQSILRNKKVGGSKLYAAKKAFKKTVSKKLRAEKRGKTGHTAKGRKILDSVR